MKEKANSEHAVVVFDPQDHDLEAPTVLSLESFPRALHSLQPARQPVDCDRMRFLSSRHLISNGRDHLAFVMNKCHSPKLHAVDGTVLDPAVEEVNGECSLDVVRTVHEGLSELSPADSLLPPALEVILLVDVSVPLESRSQHLRGSDCEPPLQELDSLVLLLSLVAEQSDLSHKGLDVVDMRVLHT